MLRARCFPLLLIVLTAAVSAQSVNDSSSMPGMDHSSAKIIDGRLNPELIPDSTAYRLFFIAAGELPTATTERKRLQGLFLHRFGFQQSDEDSITRVLQEFKIQYAVLLNQFNAAESARVQSGAPSQTDQFVTQRDALVQSTRDELQRALSVDGMTRFDDVIKSEKRKMTVSATGGGE